MREVDLSMFFYYKRILLYPPPPPDPDPVCVTLTLDWAYWSSAVGHVTVTEPSLGGGDRDLAGGPSPRHGAGDGTSYSQARPPGRRPRSSNLSVAFFIKLFRL